MAGLEFVRGGFQFNANMGGREVAIDPRLVEILNATAEEFPFRVVAFSGVAARGSTQNHPGGQAIDVLILDRDGMPLANFNNGAGLDEYEEFAQSARRIQQQLYPELDDLFRWGGYFNAGGADLMHFDLNPLGMAMGNWEDGFAPGREADIAAGRNLSNYEPGFPNGNIRYTDGRMGTQSFQPDAYVEVVDYFGPAFDFYQQYGNQPIVIENLQRQLQRRGYFAGEVDGIFGAGTQAAFANFIRDQDMPQRPPTPRQMQFIRGLFDGSWINLETATRNQSPRPALADFIRFRRFVVKFVTANASIDWLTETFGVRSILLLRHPCAVVASQMRHGSWASANKDRAVTPALLEDFPALRRAHAAAGTHEEILALSWLAGTLPPLRSPRADRKWLTVFYEDLVLDPAGTIRTIFDWLGEQPPKPVEALHGRPSAMVKGSVQGIDAWRHQLDAGQQRRILRMVADAGVQLYGDAPTPLERERPLAADRAA